MDVELTPIERELVLKYLCDDNVPLTVTLEDKPSKGEAEISGDKLTSKEEEDRVPASAVFPVALPAEQLTVLDKGIILLKNSSENASSSRSVQPFLGKTVRVQFYFHHVGLYFITEMKEYSHGLALVVPKTICRVPDVVHEQVYEAKGELSFLSDNGSAVQLPCFPLANYSPFVQPRWDEIQIEKQHEAKDLLEAFVMEAREDGNSIGNGLYLLTICRYLTEDYVSDMQSVEGREEPLSMLYVDEQRIVLATRGKMPLSKGAKYNLTLDFQLPQNRLVRRVIKTSCEVQYIYEASAEKNSCAVCSFTGLKEEDFRYLSEKVIRYR